MFVALLGMGLASLGAWLLARGRPRPDDVQRLTADLAAARAVGEEGRQQVAALQASLDLRQQEVTAARAEVAALGRDKAWLTQELERQAQTLGSTQALLDAADRKMREAFQALAADALQSNRSAFLDLAKTSFDGLRAQAVQQVEARQQAVDALVQPIARTLAQVDQRLTAAEQERIAAYSRLSEQITQVGTAAGALERALRTPAVRGRWGEVQLRRVVEIAGMLQRCDFDEQHTMAGEGGRLRPDMVIHLPGRKRIVVDAKAPLEAYLDAQACTDQDDTRAIKLQAHARQVRQHVEKLGQKAYWDALEGSPELVILFLPGEPLFTAALQQDLTLIEDGLAHRVLLASPITLIALLTTIAHTWRQEALAENYREVARLGREFYERLARFTEHFDEVRKKLDGAVQAYNQAAGSFESRVLVSARRLKELDVTTAADLPPADPIDTVPRVLRQAGLMGVPDEAVVEPEET